MRYRCPGCGYIYDEARGDPHEGFAPGTAWAITNVRITTPATTRTASAHRRTI